MTTAPPTSRTARAFTLLEVLLAVTVLGLITVLISAMNAQLRDWSDDGERTAGSVRVQQAVELMRDQWAARVQLSGGGDGVLTDPAYLSFVTTRPVLDPSFPIVRATYRWVERDTGTGETLYDLVYEETPEGRIGPERDDDENTGDAPTNEPRPNASSNGEPTEEDADDRKQLKATIDEPALKWPLIESAERGNWERFGQGGVILRNDEAGLRDAAPTTEFSLASEEVLRAERRFEWRHYDETIPRNAEAVRVVGESGKEGFTCVFVIAASR